MKKIIKKGIIIASIGMLAFLSACYSTPEEETTTIPTVEVNRQLVSIIVEGGQRSVFLNHVYNHDDVSVYAQYSDNYREDVTSLATFSQINTSSLGDKSVTVSYENQTTTYTVSVIENSLVSITAVFSNHKREYNVGEEFNQEGLSVYANYEDGTRQAITDYSLEIRTESGTLVPNNIFSTIGTYKVIVKYGSLQDEYDIRVYSEEAPVITGIRVVANNERVLKNDVYNHQNVRVEAIYSDNHFEDITANSQISFSSLDTTTVGIKQVTVTYLTFSTNYNVEVYERNVTSISLNYDNVDRNYILGETFDSTGLIVTATYEDQETGEVENYIISVIAPDMTELHDFILNMAGTYTVNITYGGQTQSFTINVVEPSVIALSLNYNNVLTTYNVGDTFNSTGLVVTADYNNNTSALVSNFDIQVLDSNGSQVNGPFNLAGIYTICVTYQGQTQTFNVTVNEPRELLSLEAYAPNERVLKYTPYVRSSDVIIYAIYSDESRDDVTEDAYFNAIATNVAGTKQVNVSYQGKRVSYDVEVYEKTIISLDVDTSNAQLDYDLFDYLTRDGIVVTATYDDLTTAILTSYSITIVYPDYESSSTNLGKVGTFKVNIKADSFVYSYYINVTNTTPFEVTFGYSGAPYPQYNYEFSHTFTPGEPVDPTQFITNIPGYFFVGFSPFDWDNPQPEYQSTNFVKLYYEQIETGKAIVSFVDNYTYSGIKVVNLNTTIDLSTINEPYKAGYKFLGWDDQNRLSPVTGNCMIFAKFAKIDEDSIVPSISYNSSLNTIINLGLDSSVQYEFYVTLDDGTTQTSLTAIESSLALRAGGSYMISGYVVYTVDNKLHVKNIEDYSFTCNPVTSFRSLSENNIQVEAYSNAIMVGTEEFVNAAPEGYVLDSLALYDENNNLIEEILYDGSFSITFYGINQGNYRVDAFYREATEVAQYALTPTPGYRIHFVGYFVHSSSSTLRRIQLIYKGEILYTQYYANGSYPYNVFRFMLPIKYENYLVAGSLDFKDTINADEDWELILVGTKETLHKVIYYEYNSDKIIQYDELANVSLRQDPQVVQKFTNNAQTFEYTFDSFLEYNIEGDLLLRPYYRREAIPGDDVKQVELQVYLASDHLYVTNNYNGYVSLTKTYKIQGGEYLKSKVIKEQDPIKITPNTQYHLTFDYSYSYNSQTFTYNRSLVITSPSVNRTDNGQIVSITKTYYSVNYKGTDDVMGFEVSLGSGTKLQRRIDFNPMRHYGTVEYLKQDTTYDAIYFMQEQDGIYYAYDFPSFTTDSMNDPNITKVIIERKSDGFYGIIYGLIDPNLELNLHFYIYIPEIQKGYNLTMKPTINGNTSTFFVEQYKNNGVAYEMEMTEGLIQYIYDGGYNQLNISLYNADKTQNVYEFNF